MNKILLMELLFINNCFFPEGRKDPPYTYSVNTYLEDTGYQTIFQQFFKVDWEAQRASFKDHAISPPTLARNGRVCTRGKLTAIYGPYDNVQKLPTFRTSPLTRVQMHCGLKIQKQWYVNFSCLFLSFPFFFGGGSFAIDSGFSTIF